jgi:uncharacterized protein YdhG (YjbR/CyaY superfamily)
MAEGASSVDEYLAGVRPEARAALESLRTTIHSTVPGVVESISYGMPTFKYRGKPLAYFSASKGHLSLHALDDSEAALAGFETSGRGTIRFQPEHPLSSEMVGRLLERRKAAIDGA